MERKSNINILSDDKYLIEPELQKLLDLNLDRDSVSYTYQQYVDEVLNEIDTNSDSDDIYTPELSDEYIKSNDDNSDRRLNKTKGGIYIIMFRVIKQNKKKKLIYNYIMYNKKFLIPLLNYLIYRNKYQNIINKDLGNYCVYLDKSLFKKDDLFASNINITDPLALNERDLLNRIDELNEYNTSFYDLLNIILLLNNFNDINNMAKYVDLLVKTDYFNLIRQMFINKESIKKLDEKWNGVLDIYLDELELNLLNKSVFIVQNKQHFLQTVKDLGYDDLNEGPQSWRGQINSMSQFLSIFDLDYRNSLHNHNKFHVKNYNIDNSYELSRNKFSFKNIHMNIGNVRWYSTSRNIVSHSSDLPKKRQDLLLLNYVLIRDIMEKHNYMPSAELQLEIENTLYEQEVQLSDESVLQNRLNYNTDTYNLIVNKRTELINFLKKINFDNDNNILRYNKEYKHWMTRIVNTLGIEKISDLLLQFFMSIVSIEYIKNKDTDVETPGIPTMTAFERFGKALVERYIYTEYINYNKATKSDISLSQYKVMFEKVYEELKAENLYATFGGYFVHCLDMVDLLTNEIDKNYLDEDTKTMSYARVTPQARAILVNEEFKSFHLPNKLPMVYPPKDFKYNNSDPSKNILGGYLLNDIKYTFDIFKDKIGYTKKTILEEENLIVDWVNGTSKTPFKVNKETLNFIYEYGIEKNIIINEDDKELIAYRKNPYRYGNSIKRRYYKSLRSKVDMQRNILSIADLYSEYQEIYFPVRLDNRTRMYCDTDYFDFQKSDLAKGLILFSKPGIIYKWDKDIIEYFKAYGANMFGDGLDKKSIEQRVKWIDENSERIMNFESNDIVNKSENKTCFVSFCFEYIRFIEFMKDPNTVKFSTNLPIQLDASCNVFQHITLLTNESKMYSILNLDRSTKKDKPGDYYTHIIENTRLYINKEITRLNKIDNKSKDELKLLKNYIVLSNVIFKRSALKKTIMTLPYKASIPTLTDNIAKELIQISEGKHALYMADGSDIKINRSQIVTLIQAQKRVIEIESPKLKELNTYLSGIVEICTKLNMHIPWRLPHGAEIHQSYVTKKRTVIKPFTFIEKKYTFIKYDKTKFSLSKQKNAIIPNLIHSLDATTIGLMYEDMSKKGGIYTVHDCFAVTADNVPYLLWKIKSTYLKLYSDNNYLREFDKMVKWSINNIFGDSTYIIDADTVYIEKKRVTYEIAFPDINKVLKHDNRDDIKRLMDAAYIIK